MTPNDPLCLDCVPIVKIPKPAGGAIGYQRR
jgi:hypothetical protein